jgi:anti-sigma factor RsiW
MSDRPSSPAAHPEELLADYVDGVLDDHDRATAEEHLAQCDRCREDVARSMLARTALAEVPEVEGMGLADRIASDEAGPFTRTPQPAWWSVGIIYPRGRAAPRRRQIPRAIVGAAAAAVVLLVGVLVVPRVLSSGGGSSSSGGLAAAPAESGVPAATPAPSIVVPVVEAGATYTKAQLDQLAARLVGTFGGKTPPTAPTIATTASSQNSFGSLPPAASPSVSGHVSYDAALSTQIEDCIRTGAAVEQTATTVYLEVATVNGVPAYVGGFRLTEARLDFALAAVSQDGCTFLYGASKSST